MDRGDGAARRRRAAETGGAGVAFTLTAAPRTQKGASPTRLLFLNRSFWPDLEATGQFLTELCEDLSAEHEITFIAGPSYHVRTQGRGLIRHEKLGRVSITRTWGTRLPKRWLPARLLNLGTYYALAGVAAMCSKRPDIVIAETDPPLLGVLGALLKWRWNCRLVYNVRDLYPDIAIANGALKNRFLLGLLERANRLSYRSADCIIVLGEDMRQRLLAKGVAPEKLALVPDWVDCESIRPMTSSRFRSQFGQSFVVMYSGNLGLSQQLETVLDAAALLRDESAIRFALVGEGARKQWLVDRARQLGLRNVDFLPYRPREELAESLSAGDLHLVPLFPGAAGCVVPSKIYGILAAGRPFVAIMEDSAEIARLARENSVGFVVQPGDADGLARTIRQAAAEPAELAAMGVRARQLAEQRFDRNIATRKFAEVLSSLMNGELPPRAQPHFSASTGSL
ncbi:MAG TPA: glycosyltransferase family 4 protein [Candidatus Binataceae bacterium]|nr:glycosyltransferase family 4 protein [Candidatus Binataceae bacterium]